MAVRDRSFKEQVGFDSEGQIIKEQVGFDSEGQRLD